MKKIISKDVLFVVDLIKVMVIMLFQQNREDVVMNVMRI